MTSLGKKPNIGVILGILPGTDGEVRMSKSLGNHIPLNSNAADMYGKVMSIPDKAMPVYAELATEWSPEQLSRFKAGLATNSVHPRDAKMQLAYGITTVFYGEEAAEDAQNQFVHTFQKGDTPEEMPEYHPDEEETLIDIMVGQKMAGSRSEARRLIDQNGVKVDGVTMSDPNSKPEPDSVLQVGRRKYLRIR
jgi:tyrosyl-tRNA synthetase